MLLKKHENYHPKVFLKAWKYEKVTRYITGDMGSSSDGSDESGEE